MNEIKFLANNGKKFWAQDPLVGKNVTFKNGTILRTFSSGNPFASSATAKIVFVCERDSKKNFIVHITSWWDEGTDYTKGDYAVITDESEMIIQNGGVLNNLLAHLYQPLQVLFNRKVVAYD